MTGAREATGFVLVLVVVVVVLAIGQRENSNVELKAIWKNANRAFTPEWVSFPKIRLRHTQRAPEAVLALLQA